MDFKCNRTASQTGFAINTWKQTNHGEDRALFLLYGGADDYMHLVGNSDFTTSSRDEVAKAAGKMQGSVAAAILNKCTNISLVVCGVPDISCTDYFQTNGGKDAAFDYQTTFNTALKKALKPIADALNAKNKKNPNPTNNKIIYYDTVSELALLDDIMKPNQLMSYGINTKDIFAGYSILPRNVTDDPVATPFARANVYGSHLMKFHDFIHPSTGSNFLTAFSLMLAILQMESSITPKSNARALLSAHKDKFYDALYDLYIRPVSFASLLGPNLYSRSDR